VQRSEQEIDVTDHREAVEAARRLAKHYDAYMADDESELADDYPDIARELGGIVARALREMEAMTTDHREALEAARRIVAAESERGTGRFFEAVEQDAITIARALLSDAWRFQVYSGPFP
jgi:aromatic ring hydroxylase